MDVYSVHAWDTWYGYTSVDNEKLIMKYLDLAQGGFNFYTHGKYYKLFLLWSVLFLSRASMKEISAYTIPLLDMYDGLPKCMFSLVGILCCPNFG